MTTIKKALELKPCPFCGGEAESDSQRYYRNATTGRPETAAAIYCTSCNADMTWCYRDTPEVEPEQVLLLLTDQWNARAGEPRSLTDIKDMLKAVLLPIVHEVALTDDDPRYKLAEQKVIATLTAPGATTKSDGGGGSRPAFKEERIETTTVHEDRTTSLAAVRQMAGVAPGPSDTPADWKQDQAETTRIKPSSSDPIPHTIKMPEYRYQEIDTRGGGVSYSKSQQSDPSSTRSEVTVEELVEWCKRNQFFPSWDKARALLDQFEIRRRK